MVDIIALTSFKGSTILVPRKETIDELKTRYPDINSLLREADIAGRVEALTNSEAEYIKTFSPDTFRDRIAQAGQERSERLRGQALGEPPSDSVARTAWSETPEERETMRNSVFMGARGAVRTDKLDSLVAAVERFKEKHSENCTDKARDDIYINTGWWQGSRQGNISSGP